MKPAYRGTAIVLFVFALDVILGNASRLMGQAETLEEWQSQVIVYSTLKSFLDWVPYVLLLIVSRLKFSMDWIDEAMAVVCLLSCIINSMDWIMNFNYRPIWLDWWAFGFSLILLTFVKIKRYR